MKTICSCCKRVLGEQEPLDNPAEIKTRCPACITKEKEEALRFTPTAKPGQKQEVTLENGLKGTLWVAENKKEKLFLGELLVSGRKFFCAKDGRVEFQNYLGSLTGEETEVTVFHSTSLKINTPPRGHRKKGNPPKTEEPKNEEGFEYNCTMRVPKYYAQLMFDDMAERVDMTIEMLVRLTLRAYQEDCQKAAQKGGQSININ